MPLPHRRLRQVDVKAEQYERHVQRLEQERDQWEARYEVCVLFVLRHASHPTTASSQEMLAKYQASQKELNELVASMESI